MENNLPKIIGLCGRQFSGKSMLGKYLVEKYGYTRVYVAQALKHLCSQLLHLTVEEMDALKHTDTSFKLTNEDLKFISNEINIPLDIVIEKFSSINNTLNNIRHAYQFIGTDLIRKYNPDWHINTMFKSMNDDSKYVVDDVRFPNESNKIQENGGMLMYIVRPDLNGISHHASEESLTWHEFDKLIINNSSKDFAIKQLEDLIHDCGNQYANEKLKEYSKTLFNYNNSNKKIVIEKFECPAHISIYDRTMGWVCEEYDGVNNPLIIEDVKQYVI